MASLRGSLNWTKVGLKDFCGDAWCARYCRLNWTKVGLKVTGAAELLAGDEV